MKISFAELLDLLRGRDWFQPIPNPGRIEGAKRFELTKVSENGKSGGSPVDIRQCVIRHSTHGDLEHIGIYHEGVPHLSLINMAWATMPWVEMFGKGGRRVFLFHATTRRP